VTIYLIGLAITGAVIAWPCLRLVSKLRSLRHQSLTGRKFLRREIRAIEKTVLFSNNIRMPELESSGAGSGSPVSVTSRDKSNDSATVTQLTLACPEATNSTAERQLFSDKRKHASTSAFSDSNGKVSAVNVSDGS